MEDIRSLDLREMQQLAERMEEKPFRGKQLFQWVHGHQVSSWDEMSNLSVKFREKLAEEFVLNPLHIEKKQLSKKKDTAKYLFKLPDGNYIESVWMKYHHGNSVCISSQVGCRMGCTFCASTLSGLARNLSAGEMLSQIYEIQRETGERVSNVIVMGMGEPLDNYDNLIRFVKLLSDQDGIRISQRNITVSTCGIVPKIYDFIKDGKQVNLAISLHAPNNELRNKIMNINKAYKIEDVIKSVKEYINKTNRRVTFEYILLENVNDSLKEAKELTELLKGMNAYVNLIPYNETSHIEYKRSSDEKIKAFHEYLLKNGICATIRREFGSKVKAACGQLRSDYEEGKNE